MTGAAVLYLDKRNDTITLVVGGLLGLVLVLAWVLALWRTIVALRDRERQRRALLALAGRLASIPIPCHDGETFDRDAVEAEIVAARRIVLGLRARPWSAAP